MLGAMNKKATLIRIARTIDEDGFAVETEETVAEIRCYVEGRHGSERWANLSAFSEATELFRFRRIPGLKVGTTLYVRYEGSRYDILSVEDVKGRGMYLEALARRSDPSDGKADGQDA